jgi:hypothetical protein
MVVDSLGEDLGSIYVFCKLDSYLTVTVDFDDLGFRNGFLACQAKLILVETSIGILCNEGFSNGYLDLPRQKNCHVQIRHQEWQKVRGNGTPVTSWASARAESTDLNPRYSLITPITKTIFSLAKLHIR